jgi:hypothetical protein
VFDGLADRLRSKLPPPEHVSAIEPGHAAVEITVDVTGDHPVHVLRLAFVVGVDVPDELPDDSTDITAWRTQDVVRRLTGRRGRARAAASILADDLHRAARLMELWAAGDGIDEAGEPDAPTEGGDA